MKNKLLKNKDIIMVLIVTFIWSLFISFASCNIYTHLSFDSSELLTWDYLFTTKLFPYGDYYYPYGFIYYLKSINIIFLLISTLIIPVSFTVIFIFLKKLWKSSLFSYISFAAYILFVFIFTGISTFGRYGIVLTTALSYALLLIKNKNLSKKAIFLIGIVNGIIFIFVYDQGLYSILVFIISLIISPLLRSDNHKFKKIKYFTSLVRNLLIFFTGVIIALIPFAIYLLSIGSLAGFISNFSTAGDIAKYAKTPFFHSIKTVDNIFTIIVMLFSILYITATIYFRKHKQNIQLFSIILIFVILLLLQQKNIIRSIDTQLTFYSFFLIIIFISQGFIILRKYTQSVSILVSLNILIYLSIFLGIGLKPQNNINFLPNNFSFQSIIYNLMNAKGESKECVNKNIKSILDSNKEYASILNILKSYNNFNGKIYSYPGDPIFYLLLNQSPPYYSAIYQASPLYAQVKLIKYIQDQEINYIVYNYKNLAIQDEVPNYLRATTLHSYILVNFSPKEKVDNYLILERNKKNDDFFKNKILDKVPVFKQSLLQVNLENIPKSEGYYKEKYLFSQGNTTLVTKDSLDALNSYLEKNFITTKNTFLVIIFKDLKQKKYGSITLQTKDKLTTDVRFVSCEEQTSCVFNLSRIPLFYKSRVLNNLSSDNNEAITNVGIWDVTDNSHLW